MNNKIDKTCLKPFQLWVLNNFPFTIDDWDSITQYQMLCKIMGALKEQLEVNSDLYKKITDLENYLANLDLQEYVDNKIDEMYENGELQEIITAYIRLNGLLTFNTLSDLKTSQNLIAGSKVRTLGYHTLNDGGGATYYVKEVTNTDVVNEMDKIALYDENLIAVYIDEKELNIKHFGAYGDGEHDDSTVIQYAIKYVKDNFYIYYDNFNETSKTIFIPTGKYLISNTIESNLDNLHIKGDESILIGDGTKNCFNFTWGHLNRIENLNFNNFDKILNFELADQDQSMINIINCHFRKSNTAIYIENQSSIINIEKCRFNTSKKAIYNKNSDCVNVSNCWFSDVIHDNDDESLIITKNGMLSFKNCFFIPNGNLQTHNNIAWVEMSNSGTVLNQVLIDNCRFSSENGWHEIINFKQEYGTPTRPSNIGIASITIKNCEYIIAHNLINIYTFIPKITIENNCISATKYIDLKENSVINFYDKSTNTFKNFGKIVLKHNQIDNSNILTNYPSELIPYTESDDSINLINTSDLIKYYIGNFASVGYAQKNAYLIEAQLYDTRSGKGWKTITGILNFIVTSNGLTPSFNIISNNEESYSPTITFDYKNNSGSVDVTDSNYVPSFSNDYYNITFNFKTNATLNNLSVRVIPLKQN